ncbi:MAG: hypothetical protein ACHQ2Z_15535 [Elusimicrobiota bacterium]
MPNDIGRGVRAYAAGLGLLGLGALGAAAIEPGPYEPPVMNESWEAVQTPETVIRAWPERSRGTAGALIAKYGEPSTFDDRSLIWYYIGPWQETVVYRGTPLSADIVEQSISYDVPDKKISDLKRFDSLIDFDKTHKRLSSRSESEKLNFLAVNLANEIVAGKRNPGQARDFYRRTLRLSESGKSSPYIEEFLFPQGGSYDQQKRTRRSIIRGEPGATHPLRPGGGGAPGRL